MPKNKEVIRLNATVISSVVNDAIVLAGIVGTLFGFGKSKWFQKALTFAKTEESKIAVGVEKVLEVPAIQKDIDLLKNSALSQYAQAAIAGAKKLYDELSPAEQAAAIAFVQKHLPASVTATEKEIVAALKDAPTLAQTFAGDATFAKAQELTALLTKANAPAEAAAPAPAQQEATASANA